MAHFPAARPNSCHTCSPFPAVFGTEAAAGSSEHRATGALRTLPAQGLRTEVYHWPALMFLEILSLDVSSVEFYSTPLSLSTKLQAVAALRNISTPFFCTQYLCVKFSKGV